MDELDVKCDNILSSPEEEESLKKRFERYTKRRREGTPVIKTDERRNMNTMVRNDGIYFIVETSSFKMHRHENHDD